MGESHTFVELPTAASQGGEGGREGGGREGEKRKWEKKKSQNKQGATEWNKVISIPPSRRPSFPPPLKPAPGLTGPLSPSPREPGG